MSKEKKDLIEIAGVNLFGICPMCGHPTMLFKSEYTAYTISESGWITGQTDSTSEFKIICPECEFVYEVEITPLDYLLKEPMFLMKKRFVSPY
ncbi:MAG: hypothetical protein IJ880_13625 [Bacilli bacterium]|nr:hypothetical protein [Bacilli bacterium]